MAEQEEEALHSIGQTGATPFSKLRRHPLVMLPIMWWSAPGLRGANRLSF